VSQFQVTIEDVEKYEDHFSMDLRITCKTLVDFYYSEVESRKKLAEGQLDLYTEAGNKALKLLGHVPYYSRNSMVRSLLEHEDMPMKASDLFPLPVYISSSPSDKNTVGIMVYENGKLEMFEGNDEASDDTYFLVNSMLNPNKEEVTVFAMHTEDLVEKIRKDQILPAGIYVSPNKEYAAGHFDLGKQRLLFSCKITKNCVREESDVDWKIMVPCRIKQLRLY
jgi:hypothetical protein